MQVHELNLNDRAFQAIINRTKRIEIRANTGGTDYGKFKIGEKVVFSTDNGKMITCEILEINHYDTIEELLMLEGTRYTTSSTNDYNEAINNVLKLHGYKEAILKGGVYAIHIKYLGEGRI